MLKAALFDMDGTIIDTRHIWDDIVGHFVGQENIARFRELRALAPGTGMTQACSTLKMHFGFQESDEDIIVAYEQRAREVIEKNTIEFVAGFQEFHYYLQNKGIMTALVTNAPGYALNPIKNKLKLESFFEDRIFNSCMIGGVFKPDPTIYNYVLGQLKVHPDECIVFEDTIKGMVAAQKAGIENIIYMRMGHRALSYDEVKELLFSHSI